MQIDHLGLMIHEACSRGGETIALRRKLDGAWQETTYREMGETIRSLARALRTLGIGTTDPVAIFSQNRPEWAIADFAVQTLGCISVPVYATNTAPQVQYILDDAQVKILFVGGVEQLAIACEAIKKSITPPIVISFDAPNVIKDPKVLWLDDLLKAVESPFSETEVKLELKNSSPSDVATIIYTSGTTGEPKGVRLTHGNFAHQALAVSTEFQVGPDDRSLCFLPLSHVYERSWSYFVFSVGAQNNYLEDPRQVIEVMQEVKPTVMVSVPRLYEKIYGTVFERLEHAPAIRRTLFHWAVGIGFDANMKRATSQRCSLWLTLRHWLADRLVLSKIRDVVGGPKNFFSAGGAPLSKEIEEFFLSAGLLVCQGYGLTETSPIIAYNTPGAFRFGTVGHLAPDCEVRIADDGEIQVKGANVMDGYHNKPEANLEAFVDGWFRTGDVGELDPDGFLRITDRIKDLIITSGGKNIAPQAIEMEIGKDHFIEQLAVIGDRHRFVTALVVPSFPAIEEWAERRGLAWTDHETLLSMPEVHEHYRSRIDTQSRNLAGFEQIKFFTLLPQPFSQEGGEITPTLKLRRKQIGEKYAAEIEAMYSK